MYLILTHLSKMARTSYREPSMPLDVDRLARTTYLSLIVSDLMT